MRHSLAWRCSGLLRYASCPCSTPGKNEKRNPAGDRQILRRRGFRKSKGYLAAFVAVRCHTTKPTLRPVHGTSCTKLPFLPLSCPRARDLPNYTKSDLRSLLFFRLLLSASLLGQFGSWQTWDVPVALNPSAWDPFRYLTRLWSFRTSSGTASLRSKHAPSTLHVASSWL